MCCRDYRLFIIIIIIIIIYIIIIIIIIIILNSLWSSNIFENYWITYQFFV